MGRVPTEHSASEGSALAYIAVVVDAYGYACSVLSVVMVVFDWQC
jgi:hypothetical protein